MDKKEEIIEEEISEEIPGNLDKFEDLLNELKPTVDDFIERRIHHRAFAKVIFWLNIQSMKTDFIYTNDLKRYMKLTQTRAYQILNDLVGVGIMKKNGDSSNIVEFHFVKNGDEFLISKYFEKAKRTLGI